ncbi:MAG: ABC transporter ATP-binding protein [Candidatus Hodarchaeales archaeon]|jgi:ABC-2 type transport system ATP-binding protein
MTVIQVSGLIKDYSVKKKKTSKDPRRFHWLRSSTTKFRALDSVDFTLDKGEFLGYIGPNGSGKSTTIKLLTGVLTPTSGSASVLGHNPWKREKVFTRQIGVIFGNKSLLFWDLPVLDSLKLYKDIYNLNQAEFDSRLDEFDKIFQLSKLINRPVRKLSLGERMRSEIAAALIHNPPVLFLDEPTIGLDSLAKQEITSFLKKYQQREKTTVILTTHTISDIEALCERVIILHLGKIIYDGSINNLKGRFDDRTINLTLKKVDGTILINTFTNMTRQISELSYEIQTTKESVKGVLTELLQLNLDISDIKISEPGLESIIKEIYQWDNMKDRL